MELDQTSAWIFQTFMINEEQFIMIKFSSLNKSSLEKQNCFSERYSDFEMVFRTIIDDKLNENLLKL